MSSTINISVVARDAATKALRGIGKQVQGFAKGLSTAFIGLAAAGAGVIGGLGAMVSRALASADMIDKMAERTGLTREQLQELNYVLGQSGVPMADLETAIKGLVQRIPKAGNAGSEAAKAFNELGINLLDANGQLRPMSELFPDVIEALRNVENPTRRAALAQLVLSESGSKLMPILNMTKEEYDAMRQRAHELDLVLTDEQIAALVEVGDKWDELTRIVAGVRDQMALQLLPFIKDELVPFIEQSVIPKFREWAEKVRDLVAAFAELDPTTKTFFTKMVGWTAVLVGLGTAINLVISAFKPLWLIVVKGIIPAMTWFGGVLNSLWTFISLNAIPVLASLGVALRALGAGPVGMIIAALWLAYEVGKLLVANWEEIQEASVRIWGAIRDFVVSATGSMVQAWEDARTKAVETWGAVRDWISTVADQIAGWFTGLATAAVDWGRNMMQGFLNGITGMMGRIRDRVTSFVQSMVDKVKGVLGMHSPSKVFADIGRNAGQSMLDAFGTTLQRSTPGIAGGVVPALVGAGRRSASLTVNIGTLGPGVTGLDRRQFERMMQQWWNQATRAGGL